MHEPSALSNTLMGTRVKAAREASHWTQDQLALALGLKDRQSVSDIENGKRAVKSAELLTLADLLGQELEFFIDPFAVAGEAQFCWRSTKDVPEKSLQAFELQASHWVGLLRWLRMQATKPPSPLKRRLRLSAHSRPDDAMACAEALAASLEMGRIPSTWMVECIERNLDIPVLFVDTAQKSKEPAFSAATCDLHDLGVLLVNRQAPATHQFFYLAQELFHALTWDAMTPAHRVSNVLDEARRIGRIEQMANHFAAAFLMPTASLDQLVGPAQYADAEHLALVAEQFRVPPWALAWRLLGMQRIDQSTHNALRRRRELTSGAPMPKRFSLTFAKLLHSALDNGQLSSRKAAKAMGMSLSELSKFFVEHALTRPFEL